MAAQHGDWAADRVALAADTVVLAADTVALVVDRVAPVVDKADLVADTLAADRAAEQVVDMPAPDRRQAIDRTTPLDFGASN